MSTPFLELLPATGVSVSVYTPHGGQSTVSASDATAVRLEELQFTLGEGPHWEALRTGKPALAADLQDGARDRWPLLAAAALETGVRGMFSFPMQIGAITVGVVDLHRFEPGPLSPEAYATAETLTARVARPAAALATRWADDDDAPTIAAPEMRRELHQATGMVLVQLNISATEAFLRLRAHAFSTGRPLHEVARDVVERKLDFSRLPD